MEAGFRQLILKQINKLLVSSTQYLLMVPCSKGNHHNSCMYSKELDGFVMRENVHFFAFCEVSYFLSFPNLQTSAIVSRLKFVIKVSFFSAKNREEAVSSVMVQRFTFHSSMMIPFCQKPASTTI